MTNLDSILKSRDIYFANKGPSSQGYGFSSSWRRNPAEGKMPHPSRGARPPGRSLRDRPDALRLALQAVLGKLLLGNALERGDDQLQVPLRPALRQRLQEVLVERAAVLALRLARRSLQSQGLSSIFSNTTVQKHLFVYAKLSV